jgi:hypothetical protein
LYGRFKGSSRPEAMSPPANTVALNPYARPQSTARPGEVPRGAQLLTSVQRSPGRGRDLYASPDGNVYLRKNDGWFRREASGNWSYFAPTQGRVEREQSPASGKVQPTGGGVAYRPLPGASEGLAGSRAGVGRLPDTGTRARAQEVSGLERQYYARALGQMRAQNWRGSGNFARRGGAGRARR